MRYYGLKTKVSFIYLCGPYQLLADVFEPKKEVETLPHD